ncbi:MAG: signal peptidase I, partial [Nitrospirae bacterium GWD2_57_9]
MKDPWLSVLLSRLFPGAGQIYAGAKVRGLFFIGFTILTYSCLLAAAFDFLVSENAALFRKTLLVAFVLYPIFIVLSIYVLFDAYKTTKRRNIANAEGPAVPVRRKPWLAAFLSALFPGIGQFYNRQWIKGIAFIAAVVGVSVLEEQYLVLFIPGALVVLFAIKDAFDSAETINGSQERFFEQKKAVVLFVVIMISLSAFPLSQLIKEHAVQAFKIPSGAMLPTLMIGDHLLVAKTEASLTSVQRGDVIVFPYPENPEKNFIKRAIGLGGDKVQYINGELFVNDQMVPAKFLGVAEDGDQQQIAGYGPPAVYEEQIGNRSYRVQYLRDRTKLNGGPWLVPQD